MMSAAAAAASTLPPRSLEDVDELTEALGEMYLPLPLLLVPLTIVVANAAPLLPPVSLYVDDETDLQNLSDIRILRSSRFTGPGLWPRSFAPLPREIALRNTREYRRRSSAGLARVHATEICAFLSTGSSNWFYFATTSTSRFGGH